MEFTAGNQFTFQPIKTGVPVDTVGVVYQTPGVLREVLRDFSRLSYLTAQAVALLEVSEDVTVKVVLKSAIRTLLDIEQATNSGVLEISQEIDLSDVGGTEKLYWEIEVVTQGSPGSDASFMGKLNVHSPLIISNC
jgi:hypothetical protein